MPLNYAGPARHARRRQHVACGSSTSSARRSSIAVPCAAACAARPGRAPMATVPGIGPEAAADAKLNIVWGNNATVTNLHLVRKIRACAAQGRPAGGDRSAAHARSPSRRICISRPGPAPTCCWASRSPSSWSGSAPTTALSSRGMCSGYDEFMALARAMAAGKGRRGMRRAAPTTSARSPAGWRKPIRW